MSVSVLAGTGIHDAEELFSTAPAPTRAEPQTPDMLPSGAYVLGEPRADAPFAGMICMSWHHGADAPPARCPNCGSGQA